MTQITYITTTLPPTEMWVEARTAIEYRSQGFELVEYKSPPAAFRSCYSGRALIRQTGGPTPYTYSPELCDLHKRVSRALDSHRPPWFIGRSRKASPASREFDAGHTKFYVGEIDYHRRLMKPLDGDTLEDVVARVVTALEGLASEATHKVTRAAWSSAAQEIQGSTSGSRP